QSLKQRQVLLIAGNTGQVLILDVGIEIRLPTMSNMRKTIGDLVLERILLPNSSHQSGFGRVYVVRGTSLQQPCLVPHVDGAAVGQVRHDVVGQAGEGRRLVEGTGED